MGDFIAYQNSAKQVIPVSSANPLPVTGGGSGSTPISTTPALVTGTSKSNTITLGGTAQPAIAANAVRKGWSFGNVSATMYVTDDGSTPSLTNGMVVNPGELIDDGGKSTASVIQVYCATTGATFSAVEYT